MTSLQIPVMKPLLPTAARILPYIERIDATRWYSNMGPLVTEFEARLAEHFGVEPDQVVTSANGTLAMVQTLQALGTRTDALCLAPSWTFVATAAAAQAAGLRPFFMDVDPHTWALDPVAVEAQIARGEPVGAVIAVVPFGARIDLEAWEGVQRRTGVPVLIDAAAGFDTFAGSGPRLPTMISLHATKVFGVGEGAVMISPTAELARAIRRAGNFGFMGSREAQAPGFNAKLSEYTAAVGLAGFDVWPETRRSWVELTEAFNRRARQLPELGLGQGFGGPGVLAYGNVVLPAPYRADEVCEALARSGIETRQWWGKGCHTHAAYSGCPRESLAQTEALADRVIGLPFWIGLEPAALDHIFERLRAILGGPA